MCKKLARGQLEVGEKAKSIGKNCGFRIADFIMQVSGVRNLCEKAKT
jgi:hypothetical protein